jgi:hypothetical protein
MVCAVLDVVPCCVLEGIGQSQGWQSGQPNAAERTSGRARNNTTGGLNLRWQLAVAAQQC